MNVTVEFKQGFRVPASPAAVFDLLADVPRSVGHFPELKQLVPLGEGAYRWEMKPLGAAGISHQVIYASRYVADAASRSVIWTPVKKVGNGQIEGRWLYKADRAGTAIDFATVGELEVPVPLLLRAVAAPFVQGEFRRQVQRYLDNIRAALGG